MMTMAFREVETPKGKPVTFDCRQGTNDADLAVALNVWNGTVCDEYRMRDRELSGFAIDVGAHIGALAIPMALDHPDLTVIAIEAVPENATLCLSNAQRNGAAVIVLNAAAAAPGTPDVVCHYGYRHDIAASDGYVSAHRFVAQTFMDRGEPEFTPTVTAVSLDEIIERYAMTEVALLKIDCEGCEWAFLDTLAVGKVRTIVGEYHGGLTGVEDARGRLIELLSQTHDVTFWSDEPICGLFEAVRR
jgi:FkbM family methyltransferase